MGSQCSELAGRGGVGGRGDVRAGKAGRRYGWKPNALFGGTLADLDGNDHHRTAPDLSCEGLFEHRHDIDLAPDGRLAEASAERRLTVNSVHHQGVNRLGADLRVEAVSSEDGLVEAFSANPCGGEVLAVQWHPEWDTARQPASRAFFELIGDALAAPAACR